VRVSLFIDAGTADDVARVPEAADVGADRVELYTEPWASAAAAKSDPAGAAVLAHFAAAARAAHGTGLGVNAGHDLNLHNLPAFVATVPHLCEVSVGHAFVADALEFGYAGAVRRYLRALGARTTGPTAADV